MNPIYFLLLIPLLAPFLVLHFTKRFTLNNLFPACGFAAVGTLVCGLIIGAFLNHSTSDTEVINGFVTTKEINKFICPVNTSNPCKNDYSCNCEEVEYDCGTSDKPETCTRTECDTCYTYAWEKNYFIDSSLQGERAYQIARVDPQGAIVPPRWATAKHGDPVSITQRYTNYIHGAIDSLFSEDGRAEEKYRAIIPPYPLNIYDYYRIDRLVTVGKVNLDRKAWNHNISRILAQVGPRKEANVVVVIAEGVGMDFANAVRRAWKGFKKNDIVVFAGVDTEGKLVWTRTMSWSKASIVNIKMESEILRLFSGKVLEPVLFTETIKSVSLEHFERRSMEDFAYLKGQAKVTTGQLIGIWIFSLIICTGLVLFQLNILNALPTRYGRSELYSPFRLPNSKPTLPSSTRMSSTRSTKSRFRL